jgi:hypothetical protein
MSKIGRIFRVLFDDEIKVAPNMVTEEIGFGSPMATQDTRLEFNRDTIMAELKTPPIKIEKGKILIKIMEIKKIIASLEKKKMDVSVYQEALSQLNNRKFLTLETETHLVNYPTTIRAKIEELSTKYKLVFKNLQGITRDLPLGAVKAIETFCQPLEKAKITFTKENFFLIAPEDWWRKKRDPILLCKSPLGNYYYILYAWDKEVDIVGELFD